MNIPRTAEHLGILKSSLQLERELHQLALELDSLDMPSVEYTIERAFQLGIQLGFEIAAAKIQGLQEEARVA